MKLEEEFEFETTKKNEGLVELRSVTNHSILGLNNKALFIGEISDSSFKLKKIANGSGFIRTVSIGYFSEEDGKTMLQVSIRPDFYNVIFSIIFFGVILFLFTIVNLFLNWSDFLIILIFIFFIVVVIAISVFSYDEEKTLTKNKIIQIFK